jgi:hypothetical protein
MEQLVNGTDPTALEKNLHSSIKFFCPWMAKKRNKRKTTNAEATGLSAADTDTDTGSDYGAGLSAADTDTDSEYEEQAEDAKKEAASREDQYQFPTARTLRRARQMIQPFAEALAAAECAKAPRGAVIPTIPIMRR